MGTRVAPPYANLFMGKQESTIFLTFAFLILFRKRFIDDIFFIFTGTDTDLTNLMTQMNAQHPKIKYTFEYSTQSIAFLDVQLYIDNDRKLRTRLHKKPTDCNSLLHYKSYHPLHTKESVIYSQALRYNMLNYKDTDLTQNLYELTRTLLIRDYPLQFINKIVKKALTHTQQELINKERPSNTSKILPFITTYSQAGTQIAKQIQSTWPTNPTTINIWERPPINAFKKSQSLTDILIHTKQHHAHKD